jgi:hypothetical protein
MNSAPTNQHYVPQFVLRNFASGRNKQIHVFEKTTGKSFKTAVRNIAAETGFYDFEIDGRVQSLDPSLQMLESVTNQIIQRIVRTRSLKNLNDEERSKLALFVTVQMLRTTALRKQSKDLIDKIRDGIVQRGGDPNHLKGFQNLDEEQARIEGIRMLPSLARDLAPHFLSKAWILYSTSERCSFYISDNPITLQNTMNQDPLRGTLGLGVPGIEIYFPLNETLCLGFLCPTIETMIRNGHYRARQMDASISLDNWIAALNSEVTLGLNDDSVTNLNSLQVINAERYVFSGNSNFRLVREMLESDPELKSGLRYSIA